MFYHKDRERCCSVHGCDLTTSGSNNLLEWFKLELEKHYEPTEAHRRGQGTADDKDARIPNRMVRWIDAGFEYEADPRQPDKLLGNLKVNEEGVKSLGTPGLKATRDQYDSGFCSAC